MYLQVFCGIMGMKCVKGARIWIINGGTIWWEKWHIWDKKCPTMGHL